jgi:predicted metalloprotease with PDZ domain
MQPYDYTKENYSKLGYVCEGVTTYYGDYLLLRSNVFSEQDYFKTFDERLQKHFDNFGRFNMSVADSSFDTWLDGYSPGIPNRKTNIYDEGNLLAFVTDIFIRRNSDNKNSLDDVMRYLYEEFALKGKGYSERDYKGIVEHFAGASFEVIFTDQFNGTADYEPLLKEAMGYIGCELTRTYSTKFNEHALGMKVNEVGGICKVTGVYLGSTADKAGLAPGDDVISINGIQVKPDASGTNFTEWCNYFGNQEMKLVIATSGMLKNISLVPAPQSFYPHMKMEKISTAGEKERTNYELWSLNKF